MMPLCAAEGAQFVRSFSSSLSTEKPQCCGKHEIVQSVPLPPLGEACHPCLVAPPQCQACATGQGVALQPPVQDMQHQLATQGSAATQPIIVAEISSLCTRALPFEACCRHPARGTGPGIVTPLAFTIVKFGS